MSNCGGPEGGSGEGENRPDTAQGRSTAKAQTVANAQI